MAPQQDESEAGIGVEFLGGSPEQFSALADFIERGEES
jgi:hypothetical protein